MNNGEETINSIWKQIGGTSFWRFQVLHQWKHPDNIHDWRCTAKNRILNCDWHQKTYALGSILVHFNTLIEWDYIMVTVRGYKSEVPVRALAVWGCLRNLVRTCVSGAGFTFLRTVLNSMYSRVFLSFLYSSIDRTCSLHQVLLKIL